MWITIGSNANSTFNIIFYKNSFTIANAFISRLVIDICQLCDFCLSFTTVSQLNFFTIFFHHYYYTAILSL